MLRSLTFGNAISAPNLIIILKINSLVYISERGEEASLNFALFIILRIVVINGQ